MVSGWRPPSAGTLPGEIINDETLRLVNHGLSPSEIAEQVRFEGQLGRHWAMRGYYGSLNHNVKATYVKLLRLVRRQPGQPPHAPARGGRQALRG